jgi:hypothetical protein
MTTKAAGPTHAPGFQPITPTVVPPGPGSADPAAPARPGGATGPARAPSEHLPARRASTGALGRPPEGAAQQAQRRAALPPGGPAGKLQRSASMSELPALMEAQARMAAHQAVEEPGPDGKAPHPAGNGTPATLEDLQATRDQINQQREIMGEMKKSDDAQLKAMQEAAESVNKVREQGSKLMRDAV